MEIPITHRPNCSFLMHTPIESITKGHIARLQTTVPEHAPKQQTQKTHTPFTCHMGGRGWVCASIHFHIMCNSKSVFLSKQNTLPRDTANQYSVLSGRCLSIVLPTFRQSFWICREQRCTSAPHHQKSAEGVFTPWAVHFLFMQHHQGERSEGWQENENIVTNHNLLFLRQAFLLSRHNDKQPNIPCVFQEVAPWWLLSHLSYVLLHSALLKKCDCQLHSTKQRGDCVHIWPQKDDL